MAGVAPVTSIGHRAGHLPTVLIADSDGARRREALGMLIGAGFDCFESRSVDEAVAVAGAGGVGAVILELSLPGRSPGDAVVALRRATAVPLLVITGAHDVGGTVGAFERGADDCVTSPFAAGEVVARTRALLRRGGAGAAEPVVAHEGLRIDLAAREATLDGCVVELTRREFDLLAFLAATPRRAFSRDELLRHVWSSCDRWQDPSTVTEHVRRIRRKIERDPQRPRWITTIRSVGYRFEPARPG